MTVPTVVGGRRLVVPATLPPAARANHRASWGLTAQRGTGDGPQVRGT